MIMKRPTTKGVSLTRQKVKSDALEKSSDDASSDDVKTAAVNVSLAELEDRVADVRDSWETDSLFEDAFEELSKEKVEMGESEHPPLDLVFFPNFNLFTKCEWKLT